MSQNSYPGYRSQATNGRYVNYNMDTLKDSAGFPHAKKSCKSCKIKHEKCEWTSGDPRCLGCKKRGIICEVPPRKNGRGTQRGTPSDEGTPSSSRDTYWDDDPEERSFLMNSIQEVYRMMTGESSGGK